MTDFIILRFQKCVLVSIYLLRVEPWKFIHFCRLSMDQQFCWIEFFTSMVILFSKYLFSWKCKYYAIASIFFSIQMLVTGKRISSLESVTMHLGTYSRLLLLVCVGQAEWALRVHRLHRLRSISSKYTYKTHCHLKCIFELDRNPTRLLSI